jgi:hypothetical protein
MGIYRGPGGSGDATNDASSETRLAVEARDAAIAAKVAAETAQTAAELAETNAETAETNAETAETNAETAQTAAELAETNAETAQAAAEAAQAAAETAQTAAELAETNAETAETNAETAASTATTQAGIATTKAGEAASSASAAATSATNAAASYDAFDDRYLGAKSSNPTVDNDNNALITGALYFNTTVDETRVWNGSAWLSLSAAGATVTSFNTRTGDVTLSSSDVTTALTYTPLAPSAIGTTVQAYDAQLADVAGLTPSDNGVIIGNGTNFVVESGATVRTSLGLGTAATTASTDYATAAQGAKADTALQPAAIGVSVQAYDADLDAFALKTAPTGAVVGTSDTQTLTNKTIALGSNTVSGTLAEFNTAVTDADFASIAGTETLTNKTLTSPTINTATISGGTINNASVGASTPSTGAFTSLSASGAFAANGGATLGDASGDALTINSSAVSIPNGLNFGSNNLVLSSGNVGIGTSSPSVAAGLGLVLNGGTAQTRLGFKNTYTGDASTDGVQFALVNGTSAFLFQNRESDGTFAWETNGSERMRIDSSGNVGIGTSSPSSYPVAPQLVVAGSVGCGLTIRSATTSYGGVYFADGTTGGEQYRGFVQYDHNQDVLQLATNATERMRIDSSGNLLVGKAAAGIATAGSELAPAGDGKFTVNGNTCIYVNRLTSDGALVSFRQAGTEEGTISVSGTTVSYNGGHLARWSQLLDGSKDDTLLKGTVLSNLDEMCVWTKDGEQLENEQLNKMKVSDVEGDTNVAGVFVNWTRDEDCNTDDMNIAMTGDMIIRIAQGVTVARGDLLMSAGDGTAKPQGDDIVRSKTIAKVTSTNITCTYADGSYCVPCVLMAC